MAELRKSTAMIFVSHNMPQVYRISSQVLVLDHGSAVYLSDQIGEGIQRYYQLQDTDQSQVLGGDLISISDVRFESDGAPSDEELRISVNFGSPLQLSFRLKVDPKIDAVGLKLSVWNQEMLPVMDVVAGTMRNYELHLGGHTEAEIEVVVDRIPFSTGQHSISIVVTDTSYLTIYGRVDNVGSISVKAPYPTGAHQIGVADWKHSLI
jgi:lipopolysaccharide transport system ATP-binding protein